MRLVYHRYYVPPPTNEPGCGWDTVRAMLYCKLFQAGNQGLTPEEFLHHARFAMEYGGHRLVYIEKRCVQQSGSTPAIQQWINDFGPQAPGTKHTSGRVEPGEHMFTVI